MIDNFETFLKRVRKWKNFSFPYVFLEELSIEKILHRWYNLQYRKWGVEHEGYIIR